MAPTLDVAALRAEFSDPHEIVQTSDGKTLFVRRWGEKANASVSILIFHGITGHSGPYGPMIAQQLSAEGFNVFGMDLRGHGLSDGKRGDYPSKERFDKDLSETVALVKSKSRKLVFLGHSLGVLSAVDAAKSCPKDVDGVILLSAARKLRKRSYPRPSAAATLKALFGIAIFRGSPLIEYRREGMIGRSDPLFNFKYSARFYSVLYGTGALRVLGMYRSGVIDSPNLKLGEESKLAVPLIVGVGDQDELFATEAVKEFYDKINCDNKEFFTIPGGRHAVFPKDSWGPVSAWLRKIS
jgi:acylglycerol lipase